MTKEIKKDQPDPHILVGKAIDHLINGYGIPLSTIKDSLTLITQEGEGRELATIQDKLRSNSDTYQFVGEPKCGWIRFCDKNDKWNYVNAKEKRLSKEGFDKADDFGEMSDGKVRAMVGERGDDIFGVKTIGYYFIDQNGIEVGITLDGKVLTEIDIKGNTKLCRFVLVDGCLKQGEEVREKQRDFKELLIENEKEVWKNVLGVDIEIPQLPDYITPDVKEKLKNLGMELRFIPKLDLGTPEDIKRNGVDEYIKNLQKRYPNWRKYETLTDAQKGDHSVSRNIEAWRWNFIKNVNISFINLLGKWIAVETISKPKYGDKYAPSKITDILGFEDRFNINWYEIRRAINSTERKVISAIGVPENRSKVILLGVVEWNLLANREGWGKTNTYEWTNTGIYNGYDWGVFVGCSDNGGAACVEWDSRGVLRDNLGFRLAIEFSGT